MSTIGNLNVVVQPNEILTKQDNSILKDDGGYDSKSSAGRWTAEEHSIFLDGLRIHNKQWKQIADLVKTRTVVQIRTHAQKYFQKLERGTSKSKPSIGSESDIGTPSNDKKNDNECLVPVDQKMKLIHYGIEIEQNLASKNLVINELKAINKNGIQNMKLPKKKRSRDVSTPAKSNGIISNTVDGVGFADPHGPGLSNQSWKKCNLNQAYLTSKYQYSPNQNCPIVNGNNVGYIVPNGGIRDGNMDNANLPFDNQKYQQEYDFNSNPCNSSPTTHKSKSLSSGDYCHVHHPKFCNDFYRGCEVSFPENETDLNIFAFLEKVNWDVDLHQNQIERHQYQFDDNQSFGNTTRGTSSHIPYCMKRNDLNGNDGPHTLLMNNCNGASHPAHMNLFAGEDEADYPPSSTSSLTMSPTHSSMQLNCSNHDTFLDQRCDILSSKLALGATDQSKNLIMDPFKNNFVDDLHLNSFEANNYVDANDLLIMPFSVTHESEDIILHNSSALKSVTTPESCRKDIGFSRTTSETSTTVIEGLSSLQMHSIDGNTSTKNAIFPDVTYFDEEMSNPYDNPFFKKDATPVGIDYTSWCDMVDPRDTNEALQPKKPPLTAVAFGAAANLKLSLPSQSDISNPLTANRSTGYDNKLCYSIHGSDMYLPTVESSKFSDAKSNCNYYFEALPSTRDGHQTNYTMFSTRDNKPLAIHVNKDFPSTCQNNCSPKNYSHSKDISRLASVDKKKRGRPRKSVSEGYSVVCGLKPLANGLIPLNTFGVTSEGTMVASELSSQSFFQHNHLTNALASTTTDLVQTQHAAVKILTEGNFFSTSNEALSSVESKLEVCSLPGIDSTPFGMEQQGVPIQQVVMKTEVMIEQPVFTTFESKLDSFEYDMLAEFED